ncbi:aminodeoxychorismate lyase [Pseudalkalibacillus berkeleyi]|uniref:Aminodeoxychorismate lyase n=1 Tax=Pseudalkalibacillus berkeleyi TaxID=1069813 RepID=A0ABS9H6A9_9BACL|nr:aminodeoxychorismate lyase [Pseudalkalibacillus berkeleyi]MCF6139651.1 aminodeoxychorismate lyase [Pseudalkalibacillus berkeleyi]
MYIYLNGDIVDERAAKISPFDYGYLYGIGLFETFRVYNGHPFLLDDHLERINHSLQELNIKWTFQRAEVLEIVEQLLESNHWRNASIRLNISAGKGEAGLRSLSFDQPTILVYGGALPEAGETLQEKHAQILSTTRNSPEGYERWKSHHFMNNLLAKQELNDPSVEGIFLNEKGYVAEGITSNVFWVRDSVLYTPSIHTGILNGITRQYVLSLCEKIRQPVKVGEFIQEDLMEADEVFVTNSVQEIVGIKSLGDLQLPGKNGDVTNALFSEYVQGRMNTWTRRT